jgi:hypothetical protein
MKQHSHGASDAALELIKHLITLSSGVLALSATFVTKISGSGSRWTLWLLGAAWFALTASVVAGLQAISAIVKSRLDDNERWSTGYGKGTAAVSKYAFVAGLALVAAFAFATLDAEFSKKKNERTPLGPREQVRSSHAWI